MDEYPLPQINRRIRRAWNAHQVAAMALMHANNHPLQDLDAYRKLQVAYNQTLAKLTHYAEEQIARWLD